MSSHEDIILIFCLVRIAFLSNYKRIISIFTLVWAASLSRYKIITFNVWSNQDSFLSSYENIDLIFGLISAAFLFACFILCEILDNQYSSYKNKTFKINIEWTVKNPEILRFVLNHLKTKNMPRNPVSNFPFVIKYFPDQYKTQEICDKVFSREWWNDNVWTQ